MNNLTGISIMIVLASIIYFSCKYFIKELTKNRWDIEKEESRKRFIAQNQERAFEERILK